MKEFQSRRREFMQRMCGGVAVIQGASLAHRYRDLPYPFRQDSDLLYLTGFEEPGALCLLAPEHPQHRFVLFVQPRDPEVERWDGPRAGVEGAVETFGADAAYPVEDFDKVLPDFLKGASTLYYQIGHRERFDLKLLWFLRARAASRDFRITRLLDAGVILGQMRSVKRSEEIEILREAARITAEAHREAMLEVRAGRFEYEVQSALDRGFTGRGATGHAFDPIVASGSAATILHYTRNQGRLGEGELLLIDAGAEFRHYVSDLTRTVPVNGRFSPIQKTVYDAVLSAQQAALELVRPGSTVGQVHSRVVRSLAERLIDWKILEGSVEEVLSTGAYKRFFMHRTSHFIGLDLRDPAELDRDAQVLEPGMALTIEPGLYFPPESDPPEAFRDIGVRIEDSVIVTPSGCEVLTSAAPKEIAEIEALMGHQR